MSGHVEFFEAFVNYLAADTGAGGLVELTGHNPANPDRGIRIGRMNPDLRERMPYVGIEMHSDRVFRDGSVPEYQKSRIRIRVCACGKLADYVTLKIGDRIEGILQGRAGPHVPLDRNNHWFADFSTEEITIKSTGFFSRSKIFEDDDTDARCQNILVDVVWYSAPCSD